MPDMHQPRDSATMAHPPSAARVSGFSDCKHEALVGDGLGTGARHAARKGTHHGCPGHQTCLVPPMAVDNVKMSVQAGSLQPKVNTQVPS